jgi:S1-C subfamily serine protease
MAGGHIVTNHHVVQGARSLAIATVDGAVVEARLVASDPITDIALLAPNDRSGPHLALASEREPRLGEIVIAIGDPFGYQGSVSFGVVSGTDRPYSAIDPIGYLQHDAAVNRGNSGGPVIDLEGRVLGMNTLIPDLSPFNIGIGFALPARLIASVVDELERFGRVHRGYLGVSVHELGEELAQALDLDPQEGLAVSDIAQTSPAEGHLKPGDVIRDCDGKPLRNVRDLAACLLTSRPGEAIRLSTLSGTVERELRLMLGHAPIWPDRSRDDPAAHSIRHDLDAVAALGIELDEPRRPRGPTGGEHAPTIAVLRPDGLAARAGLRPGDEVVAVGRTRVDSVAAALAALRRGWAGTVALLVRRGAEPAQFITLAIGDHDDPHAPQVAMVSGGPF